ncbi:hypothetical protein ABZ687_29185 [Streptomyces ardesiacus]|uniref:hypothetical protein n=1 Tax=Streptomyces ardesiacus TaxID=285564 RepID=UPI00340A51F6
MTTRSTPPRTTLPPNLTRHYYEERTQRARDDGMPVTPWYQLTDAQKASIDEDVAVFREAIRRAEDEQNIVAAYNAATTETPQAAKPEPATGPCDCPACVFDAALVKLIEWGARRCEELRRTMGNPNSVSVAVGGLVEVPASWRPETGKDRGRAGKAADGVPGEESLRALFGLPPKKAGAPVADEKPRTRAWFEELTLEGKLPTLDTNRITSFTSVALPDRGLGFYLYGTPDQGAFDAIRDRRAYYDQRRRPFPPKV